MCKCFPIFLKKKKNKIEENLTYEELLVYGC